MSQSRFRIGDRAVLYYGPMPEFCGPCTITAKEYRTSVNAITGIASVGWLYQTDRMPNTDAWWAEGCLRAAHEAAEHPFTAQLFAALGAVQ